MDWVWTLCLEFFSALSLTWSLLAIFCTVSRSLAEPDVEWKLACAKLSAGLNNKSYKLSYEIDVRKPGLELTSSYLATKKPLSSFNHCLLSYRKITEKRSPGLKNTSWNYEFQNQIIELHYDAKFEPKLKNQRWREACNFFFSAPKVQRNGESDILVAVVKNKECLNLFTDHQLIS